MTTPDELRRGIDELRRAPVRAGSLAAGLDRAAITWKPSPGAFSILENVAHLRDIEREGYLVRFRRMLAEDRPLLPDLDGARLAAERRYNTLDLRDALDGFTAARAGTVAILETVTPAMLAREGVLEGVGPVTVGRLVTLLIAHDREHLEEMADLRQKTGRAG